MGLFADIIGETVNAIFSAQFSDPAKPAEQVPKPKPPKRTLPDNEALLAELNRSKVFTFELDARGRIVLTKCKEDHNVDSLTVPDVVSRIGDNAFKGCTFLKSLYISDSVTEIGNEAFCDCTDLETVRFPKELKKLGDRAFLRSGITSAELHEGLYSLGNSTFYNCDKLREVRLPESLNMLLPSVFCRCTALEEVILPTTMNGALEVNMFGFCKRLERVHIPFGIKSIDRWAFECCHSLTDVYIPDSVVKIGSGAFMGCGSLEYIRIPDSVREIEYETVFADCTSLKRIRLPIGVRFIMPRGGKPLPKDKTAFYNCPQLHTVILGNSSFEVDEPPDRFALLAMHASLAADGHPTARRYFFENLSEIFGGVIAVGDVAAAEKILSCGMITNESVSAEEYDGIIDYAADRSSEIYVMLVKYRNEKLGFPDSSGRFKL